MTQADVDLSPARLPFSIQPARSSLSLRCACAVHVARDARIPSRQQSGKGTEWENKPVEEVVKGTFGKNQTLFNNAAQHYNHSHFWKWMKKDGGGDKMPGSFEKQITSDIGPLAKVKEDLTQGGVT